ncbi:nucleoside kinase [Fusibacter tunisiensis]|uniref:Uridine kinase n=1 Tax=Fusibacter tunisiensis TaxID=1008308 RepID=A0ABS2MRX4_9FIRM|nr:nucleoside kinase [Fusibacter tunisiensis]MBM7562181.1 uridine kinase [Fusibacter tunisiensis]
MIKLNLKSYGTVEVEAGTTYQDLIKEVVKDNAPQVVAVRCGNVLKELTQEVEPSCEVSFVDLSESDGIRIYQRGLSFIMIHAAMSCFDGIRVRIEHSLSKGLYCEFDYHRRLTHEDYFLIKEKMQSLIDRDLPFVKFTSTLSEASEAFKRQNMHSKVELLKYRSKDYIRLYELEGIVNYFYGYMVPSTGYIQNFDLIKYDEGVILMHPTVHSPFDLPEFIESPKIADVFKESERWADIMNIGYVSNLNALIDENRHRELIQIAEALHEKKIAYIADEITRMNKRVILIAGPSSSGKTTFANRLRIQLKVNHHDPITLSTDNYFVNREKTPRDENGNFDFESLAAVDVDQFNADLMALLDGDLVKLPVFDFQTGTRTYPNPPIQIREDQPIIIEGIHGLNEKLTSKIFKRDKFKIYVSALTQLNIDEHNRVPTTQTRLLRRIVRDNQFRGHSARKTIGMWPSVRRGEELYIFPFQEMADEVFNTSLPYELAVLKKHALTLLEDIKPDEPEFAEAHMLRKFLGYFHSIDEDALVPRISILKEFIGGSGFDL